MKHLKLFESYEKIILFELKNRRTVKIKVLVRGGRIAEIDNPYNMRFPFSMGQMLQRNIEIWACNNGWLMDGESTCSTDDKVFGIRKKDIPNGHQLRIMYPSKFKLESFNESIGEKETFTFLSKKYDIAKAWKMIQADPEKYKNKGVFNTVNLESLSSMFGGEFEKDGKKFLRMGVGIDKAHAEKLSDIELEEPGIFVLDGDFKILIDGWHRGYKLHSQGVKDMRVWTISDPADIKKISINLFKRR